MKTSSYVRSNGAGWSLRNRTVGIYPSGSVGEAARGRERIGGVDVAVELAADHLADLPRLVDHEGDPLGDAEQAAADAVRLGDRAVRVGQQRVVEAELLGEAALLLH